MKSLLRLTLLLTLLALLVACGPQATPAPAAESDTGASAATTDQPAAPAASSGEKVKLSWWHIYTADDQKAVLQKAADDYMAAHPNVEIEITVLENENFKSKLTTVMQSGSTPDIFQSWGGGVMNEYAKAGLLKDISAELQKDGWGDSFGKGALDVFSYEGKYYGVPRDLGMVGIWYNKELFKEAGIEKTPETWSELLDAVRALKAAGITPIALGEKDKWPGHFWWVYLAIRMGGREAFESAYQRQGAFTDEPFVQAGETLQELIALEPFQDGFLGAAYADQCTLMGNGKAAMELMGHWAPGCQRDNSTDKQGLGDALGWFPFPTVEGGKGNANDALGGGNGWVVGKDAPAEAVDFLRHLSSVEQQKAEAAIGFSIPVVKGAEAGLTDPLLTIIQEHATAAPYFQLYYDQALPPAVGSVVNDSVQELFAGTKQPQQVAAAIEESADLELN